MRVPGTYNYKYNPPRRVEVVVENLTVTYTFEELSKVAPAITDHSGDPMSIPSPQQPNSLSEREIVNRAVASDEGDKFRALFQGQNLDYPSASEADMAFACILAFWTGGDYQKMDRIFRASDRMRPKWEREDYRRHTLVNAILKVDEFYLDPGGLLTAGAHDEGNARCTEARVRDFISYCEAFPDGWIQYRDGYWSNELAELKVEEEIVATLKARRKAAVDSENDSIVKASKPSASNVNNAKRMLRHMVGVSIDEFDTSLDELNTKGGVLNLKTGKVTPHHHNKKFTYAVPVRYDPNADSSFWENWLLDTVDGDEEIRDYLQLAVGYSLTGHTREEVMFYIFGPPRAGKGVFTETLIYLLGGRPLATEVDMEMFMSADITGGSVRFSLAGLKAARFIAASESKESEWLNAKRIKRWTGNNLISCAHKYGHDFTYRPQFKIWLTSNFYPQMDADDDAAWDRLRVLEFPNSHAGNPDKTLKQQMLQPDNLRGILKWAAEGARKWYKDPKTGLYTPGQVEKTVEKAREEVDFVQTWIDEMVVVTDSQNDMVPQDLYYREYSDWCHENGVRPKGIRSLNNSLKRKGYTVGEVVKVGKGYKQFWVGAKLNGYGPSIERMLNGKV
ncbi:MAG: hypothetical protein GF414_00525 [Candidatus Altiarchaeales archaeon]|nr:hypothetical protein [Candidatus Altiarchaeales archaeon]